MRKYTKNSCKEKKSMTKNKKEKELKSKLKRPSKDKDLATKTNTEELISVEKKRSLKLRTKKRLSLLRKSNHM